MKSRLKQRLSSVGAKLFAVVFSAILLIVAVLTTYFPSRQIALAEDLLKEKAQAAGMLAGRELEPSLAFDDRETSREVFSALAKDEDFLGATLFDDKGIARDSLGSIGSMKAPDETTLTVRRVHDRIVCDIPIASKEGVRGALVVVYSAAELDAESASIRRTAIVVGIISLLFGALGALLVGRSVGRRLGALASAATAISNGDLSRPAIGSVSNDEVGELSRGFDRMVANIRDLMAHIEETAKAEQTRLDGLVRARTSELGRRNEDMRRLLDHVQQGFFTLDSCGTMSAERSRIVDTWLRSPGPSARFEDALRAIDPRFADMFQMGWEGLIDDVLPPEVTLAQMPSSLVDGDRHYRFEYSVISAAGEALSVLVVMTDVTSDVERERTQAAQRETHALVNLLLRDSRGLREFFAEGAALVHEIDLGHGDEAQEKRAIHTLKGTSASYGVASVSKVCDEVETRMRSEVRRATIADRLEIAASWRSATEVLQAMTCGREGSVEVDRKDLLDVANAASTGVARSELARRIRELEYESVDTRFARFADQAKALATRLEKGELHVEISVAAPKLDSAAWGSFWMAFTHVVRNAVDHGIESPEDRAACGKPERGSLFLRAYTQASQMIIEVEDDGRGVDWAAVRSAAQLAGLPCATDADLEVAIFRDGFSTKREITEISGRGVGLGALRAECDSRGGSASIVSREGMGTKLLLRFPLPSAEKTNNVRDSRAPLARIEVQ